MGEEGRRDFDARAADKVDELSGGLNAWAARQSPLPEFRAQVHALAERQWGEPVVVVYLGHDVRPGYEVPGRRADGSVEGSKQARSLAGSILRGAANGVASIFTLFNAGGTVDLFERQGGVKGPAESLGLALADAVRSATNAWLVYSRSGAGDEWAGFTPARVGVVSSDWLNPEDSAPPTFLWQAARPAVPRIVPRRHRIRWPDGSEFRYRPDPQDTGETLTDS